MKWTLTAGFGHPQLCSKETSKPNNGVEMKHIYHLFSESRESKNPVLPHHFEIINCPPSYGDQIFKKNYYLDDEQC